MPAAAGYLAGWFVLLFDNRISGIRRGQRRCPKMPDLEDRGVDSGSRTRAGRAGGMGRAGAERATRCNAAAHPREGGAGGDGGGTFDPAEQSQLQPGATPCNRVQRPATGCNALQPDATRVTRLAEQTQFESEPGDMPARAGGVCDGNKANSRPNSTHRSNDAADAQLARRKPGPAMLHTDSKLLTAEPAARNTRSSKVRRRPLRAQSANAAPIARTVP